MIGAARAKNSNGATMWAPMTGWRRIACHSSVVSGPGLPSADSGTPILPTSCRSPASPMAATSSLSSPNATAIRRLMHYGQILQSHALHFFHLSSPDLLFGFESEVARRNIVGVAAAHPEVARQGVLLRKFGQEVIRATAGKKIHGTGAVPGGMNRHLSAEDHALLSRDIHQVID